MSAKRRDEAVLSRLVEEAKRKTGVTWDPSRASVLAGRLRRRCRALGLDGLEDYLQYIQDAARDDVEWLQFLDVVTTHKTSFFRTRSVWEFLHEEIRSGYEARGGVRMWSAASSTGEEAASLAILANALAAERGSGTWSVLASDVSPLTVERARACEHDIASIQVAAAAWPKIPVEESFAEPEDGLRKLKAPLRTKMRFRQHNLLQPAGQIFDIVLMRNVTIYFTPEDKDLAVGHACQALEKGGVLVIGEAESLVNQSYGLEYLAPCIYRKL